MMTSQNLETGALDLERTRAYVKSVAMKYVRNEQDAEDVAQDALLLAHRYRNSFRGESRYSTWLYRVTATAALMFLRRQKRIAREIPASATTDGPMERMAAFDSVCTLNTRTKSAALSPPRKRPAPPVGRT